MAHVLTKNGTKEIDDSHAYGFSTHSSVFGIKTKQIDILRKIERSDVSVRTLNNKTWEGSININTTRKTEPIKKFPRMINFLHAWRIYRRSCS